jgi:hypothetical protein
MGDFNGNNYDDKFIGELVNFVAGDKFQTMFESFFLDNALIFTNDEEHKLQYFEIYQRFHKMFEDQLETFCEDIGLSQNEFMKKCREATTDDPKAKHYINILMSSVEYETFVKLMRIMRPIAERKKSDSKSSGSEGKSSAKNLDYDDVADNKGSDGADYSAGAKNSASDISPSKSEK